MTQTDYPGPDVDPDGPFDDPDGEPLDRPPPSPTPKTTSSRGPAPTGDVSGRWRGQNGKALFSVTGVGETSPDCSPPMTLRYSNVVLTVSGDSFDPDLVFAFPGTF